MRSPVLLLKASLLLTILSTTMALSLWHPPAVQAQSFWERLFRRSPRAEGQASGRASGGAVRDALCTAESPRKNLVAIVPASNQGDTVESHPTFFFYVPFSSSENEDLVGEFMLLTDDRYYALEQPLLVSLPQEPGLVRIELPETFPGLEVGDRYTWYFSILCEPWELSRNPYVSGWIERVSPETTDATWQESLVELTQQLPSRLSEWEDLLSFYGLGELATQPIEDLTPIER